MKAIKTRNNFQGSGFLYAARAILVAGFVVSATSGGATGYTPLNSWSFVDSTNWTSDSGSAPVSFTNLNHSVLGDGSSLVVNSTNAAWLQFNVVETNGATNLTVDAGTVMFWFASSWSNTGAGGTGPGVWGRLFEVGGYTPDSSLGWWSLYVDNVGNNIYFSAQTNDFSSNVVTCLSAPIAWTTNYFHFVALTYGATNTAMYLDGVLATNGPPLTVRPGPGATAGGFFIGGSSNGLNQAHGLFNSLYTFNTPLDAGTIRSIFDSQLIYYLINPLNKAMQQNFPASGSSSWTPGYDAITGQGSLVDLGTVANCVNGETNIVYLTNITVTAGSGNMSVTFDIGGGVDGAAYDVFASPQLAFGMSGASWTWMGQGRHCHSYSLSGLPDAACFLILGTPQDTDEDGLTDAYELLASHTDPNNPDTDGDAWTDSEEVLNGTDPLTADQPFKVFITRPGRHAVMP